MAYTWLFMRHARVNNRQDSCFDNFDDVNAEGSGAEPHVQSLPFSFAIGKGYSPVVRYL